MLAITCDPCHAEFEQPGALLFSPPTAQNWLIETYHLCAKCWAEIATRIHLGRPSAKTARHGAGDQDR
jgi:hypothetical protein